ncbi:hypothetical protein [Desulfuromonas carbonis]
MTKIMPQGDRFGEVFVQGQGPGDRSGNLRNFESMGQPGPIVIPFRGKKDLGLVFQTSKGLAMQDPVAIVLKDGTNGTGRFRASPTAAGAAQGGPGGKKLAFTIFYARGYS